MSYKRLFTILTLMLFVVFGQALAQGSASISGHTMDAVTGLPVDSVLVSAFGYNFPSGDSLYYSTYSASDGSYLLDNMQPGTYYLWTEHQNYQQGSQGQLTLSDSTHLTDIDFQLTPQAPQPIGTISGTVIYDSSGAPVVRAIMEFIPDNGYGLNYNILTDSLGNYSAQIPAGDYYVSCSIGNPATGTFYKEYYDDVLSINLATLVTVIENSVTGNIDFGIPDNASPPVGDATLSGYVWETDSSQNIPVYPAFIELYSRDSVGYHHYFVDNNPDGSYQIDEIIAGVYDVVCSAVGYESQLISAFMINSGANTLDFHLTPQAPQPIGTISGAVVFDGSGASVEGAMLEFISQNGVYFNNMAVTDSLGNYSAQIPAGDYIVSCTYRGPMWGLYFYQEYYDDVHSIAEATIVTVVENGVTSGINFGIPDSSITPANATINGYVTDNNNQPLENALVTIYSLGNGTWGGDSLMFTGLTDAQGNYSISVTSNIPCSFNMYIASAEKDGYLIEFWQEKSAFYLADPIFVFGDTTINGIDFTLDPQGNPTNNSISGTITDDSTGAPLPSAFVVGANGVTGQIVFTFTDVQGDYTLGGLTQDASYFLLFAAGGHVPEFYDDVLIWENATPVVANGAVTGINAGLAPFGTNPNGGMIAGTVVDVNGTALSGVFLTIKNSAGNVIGYDFTDDQGGYRVAGLTPGDYSVQASKVTFASETEQVQYTSGSVMMNFGLNNAPLKFDPKKNVMLPTKVELSPNYPNPFNPTTNIRFALPEAQHAKLMVYNILGQVVKELVNENLSAGRYEISWNGTDKYGSRVASGIYFFSLEAGKLKLVQKMLLTK